MGILNLVLNWSSWPTVSPASTREGFQPEKPPADLAPSTLTTRWLCIFHKTLQKLDLNRGSCLLNQVQTEEAWVSVASGGGKQLIWWGSHSRGRTFLFRMLLSNENLNTHTSFLISSNRRSLRASPCSSRQPFSPRFFRCSTDNTLGSLRITWINSWIKKLEEKENILIHV